VYLSIGELEEDADSSMVGDFVHFAAVLKSHNYTGLTLRKQIFLDLNHCDAIAPGFQAGLKFALKKE